MGADGGAEAGCRSLEQEVRVLEARAFRRIEPLCSRDPEPMGPGPRPRVRMQERNPPKVGGTPYAVLVAQRR